MTSFSYLHLEPLYTADEMRAAEAGHDVAAMMERAGAAVADVVRREYPDARRVSCLCGKGANGGDGRIAARILREAGLDVVEEWNYDADVVVDALFGTGFHGEPRPDVASLIDDLNALPSPVVSVDVPSGVNASTGEVPGTAVKADVTVAFHGRKVGHVVAPGRFYAGEVVVADIGLPPGRIDFLNLEPDTPVPTVPFLRHRLVSEPRPLRYRTGRDNKYTAGSVLIVGGSPGLTGAVCLAAEAAFRADAGYVAVAVPRESMPVVEHRLLEAVKRPLEDVDDAATRARAVAIGPGLGRGAEQKRLVARLLRDLAVPVVVDADALHELEPFERDAPTVLTPHSGELARLIGETSKWVDAHRLDAVTRAVEKFGCVVLLKGADTIVAAPDSPVLVHSSDTPTLATGGSGDVLTGILVARLAKGEEEAQSAAASAAALQTAAARLLPRRGVIASDVIAALPRVLD